MVLGPAPVPRTSSAPRQSPHCTADGIFERAGPPDIIWLRALEERAEAQMASGRRDEAKEARIYVAERQPEKASELSTEANRLESNAD